jgi:hypothetical protein
LQGTLKVKLKTGLNYIDFLHQWCKIRDLFDWLNWFNWLKLLKQIQPIKPIKPLQFTVHRFFIGGETSFTDILRTGFSMGGSSSHPDFSLASSGSGYVIPSEYS